MLEQIDRSRAHTRLHATWADPNDPRRAAYAAILALFADDPDLPRILLLTEILDMVCAAPVNVEFHSLMDVTGLNSDAVELALLVAGARQRAIRDWTSANDGEAAETFTLTRKEWRAFVLAVMDL
ncbi:hypothetical protein [Boseongicola sp. H5]|uniref:hypothetical protein n=1 Tax=Boseongicola sp. H5 TaxID=2763261 RepID=UPI001D09E34E|nr:hypothetical protein [Boseongicola sp. H5]